MNIINDNYCAWINDLAPRTNIKTLQTNQDCVWLIIGVGTLFGEQIPIKASNKDSNEINIIESRSNPTWLPPQPFLNIGVKTRLMFERFRSRSDI